jgi:ribosomal protein S12 methylthiotransferase
MAALPKVCAYMDMPLQHVSTPVLRRMRRPSNGERYLEIVEDFRRRIPGITLRSTFIVGFPGETEADVAELERWLERAELDRVGFFAYSREDGTPGAELPDQLSEREKRRRLLRLRDVQRRASERARAKRVGQVVRVLVEERRALRKSDPLALALGTTRVLAGRSPGEAPGVDGAVVFRGEAQPGTFVDVRLEGNTAFDFYGTLARTEVSV